MRIAGLAHALGSRAVDAFEAHAARLLDLIEARETRPRRTSDPIDQRGRRCGKTTSGLEPHPSIGAV